MSNPHDRPRYDQEDQSTADAFRRIGTTITLSRDDSRPLWVQLRNEIEEAMNSGLVVRRYLGGGAASLFVLDSVHDFKWTDGGYAIATGVCRAGRSIWCAGLQERALMRFDLPG